MKSFFTFIILLLTVSNCCAQLFTNRSGNNFELKKHSTLLNITEFNNELKCAAFFEKGKNQTELQLQLVDAALQTRNKITQTINYSENDYLEVIAFQKIGETNYFFISQFIAAHKKNTLYAVAVDENSIKWETALVLDYAPAYAKHNPGNYRLAFSSDHNHLAVLREHPSDKSKSEAIAIMHFDEQLKLVHKKEHIFDSPSQAHPVNIPYVNSEGDIYIIKKDRDKTQYKYTIFAIDHATEHFSNRALNIGGVFISDIHAEIAKNGHLIVCGYYSTASYNEYEGVFFFTFNASANPVHKNHAMLSSDIKSNFISKKDANKSGSGIPGMVLQYILPTDSNGVYLLSEKAINITKSSSEEIYTYEELFVLNLDPLGNIKWGTSIKKKQESLNDKGKWNSYTPWLNGDTLYVLFNKMQIDEQLLSSGSRKKSDEFGNATFAGPIVYKITPRQTIISESLLKLIAPGDKQKSIVPRIVLQDHRGDLFFIASSFYGEKFCFIELNYRNK